MPTGISIGVITGSTAQASFYTTRLWREVKEVTTHYLNDPHNTNGVNIDELHLYGTWYMHPKIAILYSAALTCLVPGGKIVVVR